MDQEINMRYIVSYFLNTYFGILYWSGFSLCGETNFTFSKPRRNIRVLFLGTSGYELFVIFIAEIFVIFIGERPLKLYEKGDHTIFITNLTEWPVNKSNTRRICNREKPFDRGLENNLTIAGRYKSQFSTSHLAHDMSAAICYTETEYLAFATI